MKIFLLYRLIRYVATYHFLSFLVIFFVLDVNEVYARSDLKTKLLLKNIRTHLAQKADEIVKKKECESGLILCKSSKGKEMEGEEEKSEEIPPPPRLVRGQHKPVIKISPKDVVQSFMPKAHKNFYRKSQKLTENERDQKMFHHPPETLKKNGKTKTDETSDKSRQVTARPDFKKPLKFLKESSKTGEKLSFDKKVSQEKSKNEYDIHNSNKNRQTVTEKVEKGTKSKKAIGEKRESRDRREEREKVKKVKKTTNLTEKAEDGLIFQPGTFIFEIDSDDTNNLCGKHSQIYLKHLKKYKIWALMMYDASAKFSSGILQGNVNNFGDFDECLAINAVFKNAKDKSKGTGTSGIRGKYCLANVDVTTDSETNNLRLALERAESFQFIKSTIHDPGHFIPRFSTINWGLCVPSACLAEDVEKFLNSRLEAHGNATGLRFDVDVDERNCVVKDDLKFKIETGTLVALLFYLAVLSVSLYATFIDSKTKKVDEGEIEKSARDMGIHNEQETQETLGKNEVKFSLQEMLFIALGKIKDIIMAFSLKNNVRKLFSDSNKGAIECINGVKSIFTIMLYFAHKTIPLGMTPFSNRIFLTKISNQPITILLRASIIYTDSFLLISGVLTSYNLAKEISEHRKISWFNKLIARFIRLTPPLFAVVLFYAYIWDGLGSGPIWNLIVSENSSLCQKHMWRNLLYIQNLFAFEHMCAPQTHQLALDMQLSLLAPLFVHLLHAYDKAGVGILQALFILSSIMRYITTSNNELSVVIYHGMPVHQLYKTANLLYGQTIHRASPYILGTVVGYHLRKFEKKIDMPKAFAALGWILSFTFGFYSVVSSSPLALRAYQYDVQEAAHYAALAPVGWSLALSWLIVACHLGYGGMLNEFLSRKIFLVFSRISYSVYLTQFLVFFYELGIKRIPEMFTVASSINITEFFIVVIISVIVTLFFDIPMMEIKKIILEKKAAKTLEGLDAEKTGEVEQSQEGLQTEDEEEISGEDLRTISEELAEAVEDEDDYENEYAEEDVDDMEDEEIEENSEDNTNEDILDDAEAEIEEVFEIRPLKRSTRMHFSDDSKGKESVTMEPETENE